MRKLYADGYNDADWLIRALTNADYVLEPGDKALDFGCGAGGIVYGLRDRGLDACGFDIHNYVGLRQPSDAALFRFSDNPITDTSDSRFDPAHFKIGFPSDTFDLVFSTSTIEHVAHVAPVMAEIARVLKPGGVAIHFYPSPSVFIEPHMFMPFASHIQSWWWLYLWALLGVRNSFQKTMTARQVADADHRYCATGLRYWTRDELFAAASPHFHSISFPAKSVHGGQTGISWRQLWSALRSENVLASIAQAQPHDCLLTADKR